MKKIIIGNWKMNPSNEKEVRKIFIDFKKHISKGKNITTVFCPPFVFIKTLKDLYLGNKVFFGAQDVFWKKEGSFTGEISVSMLKSLGVRFVIVGHSERRALGENNEMVAQKAKQSLKEDLHTVLCVGEPSRDEHGNYLHFLRDQILESTRGISKQSVKKLILAYEPIWAIGKGKTAMSPDELHRMALFVKKTLISRYGKKVGSAIPIIYGGSVDSENARDIVYEGQVDGLLVGRASLNPHEFGKILNNVSKK